MKEARIDVSKKVCEDSVAKIKSVLEQIKEQNIVVSKIEIIGDCELERIENFLINSGYIIETIGDEQSFRILLKGKEEVEVLEFLEEKAVILEEKVLLLKDDKIGEGELGRRVLDRFFVAIAEGGLFPREILLLNRAVLLCSDTKRESHKELLYLERKGVKILACQTCLEHYGVLDKICVGEISSAPIIAEILLRSNVLSL